MVHIAEQLNGEWLHGGMTIPYNVSISGSSISVILRGKRHAFGTILDSSSIMITFLSSGGSTTGKLEEPNKLVFRNPSGSLNAIWTKVVPPRDWVAALDGFWKAGEQELDIRPRIRISVSGSSISIDMSDHNRPDAHGSVLDDSTFTVTFPDDNSFTGTLEGPKTIGWSNGTVWTKVFVEG